MEIAEEKERKKWKEKAKKRGRKIKNEKVSEWVYNRKKTERDEQKMVKNWNKEQWGKKMKRPRNRN